MGKSLVIVESPAKAKTINKYLGTQYVVKSSIGHIRDLPTSGSASAAKEPAAKRGKAAAGEAPVLSAKEKARKQLVSRMGGWKARYEILPGKEKVIEELRRLAKDADTIYLATDLDREGEAIAWHLREAIGGDDSRYKRVVFNEITKKAIQEAFSAPGELDIDRVNAQQARRFLDRVVGYMVSPLLWAKIARGLSAGRVQSVAVKLVVEREREILGSTCRPRHRQGRQGTFRRGTGKRRGLQAAERSPGHGGAGEAQGVGLHHRQAPRGQTDQQQAVGPVHHLHPAAGSEQPPGLRGEEDHDDGPAFVRSRLHHLYAYRLHQPLG